MENTAAGTYATLVDSVPPVWFAETFTMQLLKVQPADINTDKLRLFVNPVELKLHPITQKEPEFDNKGWEILPFNNRK